MSFYCVGVERSGGCASAVRVHAKATVPAERRREHLSPKCRPPNLPHHIDNKLATVKRSPAFREKHRTQQAPTQNPQMRLVLEMTSTWTSTDDMKRGRRPRPPQGGSDGVGATSTRCGQR